MQLLACMMQSAVTWLILDYSWIKCYLYFINCFQLPIFLKKMPALYIYAYSVGWTMDWKNFGLDFGPKTARAR